MALMLDEGVRVLAGSAVILAFSDEKPHLRTKSHLLQQMGAMTQKLLCAKNNCMVWQHSRSYASMGISTKGYVPVYGAKTCANP